MCSLTSSDRAGFMRLQQALDRGLLLVAAPWALLLGQTHRQWQARLTQHPMQTSAARESPDDTLQHREAGGAGHHPDAVPAPHNR